MGAKARNIIIILAILLIAGLAANWMRTNRTSDIASDKGAVPPSYDLEWQKGMCYATWDKDRYGTQPSDESLSAMMKTNTEWVAIVVNWYQENASSTKIFPTDRTPTDESLVHAIKYVHSLGKKVMVKPHLDLENSVGGAWRGEISCPTDADWDAWFDSYAKFVLHYAEISEANDVEIFCMGTELTSVSTMREKAWKKKVIGPIRKVYNGPLTYAANWHEEYKYVKFWDALDYVGIDPYFPLSDKDRPDPEEIKAGWDKWVKEMEEVQAKGQKPIIFPEAGYCSADGAARTPWEEVVTGSLNLKLQADCYEALLATFWEKPWFYGVYWWKWGTDVRFGGPSNKGYSPQNKPAQDIVTQWYAKPISPHDPSVFKKAVR